METLYWIIAGWAVYLVLSKTKLLKRKQTDCVVDLPKESWDRNDMRFSLKNWKATVTRTADDSYFKNIFEVKRLGPMSWQWRQIGYINESFGVRDQSVKGPDYIAGAFAFAELQDIEGARGSLIRASHDKMPFISFEHEGPKNSYAVIERAGLSEVFKPILAKHIQKVEEWEEIPHEAMVQLEKFYGENT